MTALRMTSGAASEWMGADMCHNRGVEHLVRSQFRAIMPKEPPANPHVSEFVVGFCFSFLQTSQEFDEGIEAQLRVMGTQPSGWSPSWQPPRITSLI